MRILVPSVLALSCVFAFACSSNSDRPADPAAPMGPTSGPPTDPYSDPPTDPGPGDPGPGPSDPRPNTAPVPLAGDEIELGTAVMIAPNKVYGVQGTGLTIEQLGASMAMASDGEGNDFEYILTDIVLRMDGEEYRVAMAGGQPAEWKGFRVSIDELGFSYDKADVNVLVERVE